MHERNNTRDIRACVYSPVPENGNGEIKMKREYVRNGPFHSSPVQLPFNFLSPPIFLNGCPLYGSNGELFFDAYHKQMKMIVFVVMVMYIVFLWMCDMTHMYIRHAKSHTLSVSLMHLSSISRSHAQTYLTHTFIVPRDYLIYSIKCRSV